jgi:hypothetical protein
MKIPERAVLRLSSQALWRLLRIVIFRVRGWCLLTVFASTLSCLGGPADEVKAAVPDKEVTQVDRPLSLESSDLIRDLSVQVGVAVITGNRIGDIFSGEISAARGDGGGQVYSLMLQWTAHEFELHWFGLSLRPQFQPYATLALVDENGGSVFPDYNGGFGFRWVDFPWDKWLDTSLFVGIGLSYSSQVYAIDRERHPGKERSHLKFDWPIQLAFALPRWRQHQLVLYLDHQSGGHVFDEGGINSIGLGYRFEF